MPGPSPSPPANMLQWQPGTGDAHVPARPTWLLLTSHAWNPPPPRHTFHTAASPPPPRPQVTVSFTGVDSGRVEMIVKATKPTDPAYASGAAAEGEGGMRRQWGTGWEALGEA